jgi:hypothetical protein
VGLVVSGAGFRVTDERMMGVAAGVCVAIKAFLIAFYDVI